MENWEVLKKKAKACLEEGRYEEAIGYCDKIIEINVSDEEIYLYQGLAKFYLKRYEAAITDYSEAIALNPENTYAYHFRGFAKAKLKCYEAAIADYSEVIARNPEDTNAYYFRGFAKTKLKCYEAAIADFSEAIALNPEYATAYHDRGVTKQRLMRDEAAIADFSEAIALNPEYATAYLNRGIAKEGLKRYEAAIADYSEAIALNPEYASPYFGFFFVFWFGWQKLLPAQIHLNRFLYLVTPEELINHWSSVTTFYKETSTSQPFPIQRVAKAIPIIQDFVSWQSFLERNDNQCRPLQQYLWYLQKDHIKVNQYVEDLTATKVATTRLEALLNHYMGDPMEAYRIYDEVLDCELECISLMGQYYFISSAMDFLEPHENLLQFALQDAESYCSDHSPNTDPREWYYAGMLHILKEDWERAYAIFGQLDTFLPAAVMQVVAAEALGKPKQEIDQLKAKARSLVSTLPEAYTYQNGFPAIQLDLEREDFLTPFLHYANYREILEHIHIIQDKGVDFKYLECWEVWQLHPEDERKIQRLQREKELEAIRAQLERIFEQNLKQRYQDYPEEKIKAHEAKLRYTDADIRAVFETLEQYAVKGPEALEKEFGLQIKRWDKYIEHPEAYLLMLKYFYVKQQLPEKPAFLLYFYTHFVGAKHKYPKFAKEGLHTAGKWALETLLSPVPLGSLGAKVTTAVLWSLIQDAVKQNPQWEEDNLLSDYEQFKANFLNFLSEKVETMGRERFMERYPLEGWEV